MNKLVFLLTSGVFLLVGSQAFGQFGACDCSASAGAGTVNFTSLTWTGSGCPTVGSTTYTGNLCVSLANTTNLNFDKSSFTITGQFKITNSGNSTFTLPSPNNLHVTGNMGDNTNNNVTFVINGSLDVDGTLYGKNSNGFSGTGSVSAGGLNFNQAPTGGTGIDWNVPPGQCVPSSAFCTMVLPITLLKFDAQSNEQHIVLNWSTASELNFDYFDVERSADATDFTSIGKVTGHGTSNVRNDYSLIDEKPLIGKNYYRLKSVDFDNYTEYFKVLAVDFSGEKSFLISPNPSDGTSLGFSLNFTPAGNSSVIIFDNLGNLIGVYTPSDDSQQISFTNPLKGGIYYAKIISDEFVKVERFVVR